LTTLALKIFGKYGMYNRLGEGYLEGSSQTNPADNELYTVVRTLTGLVDSMNKRLSETEKRLAICERKLLETSGSIIEILEIPQPENKGSDSPRIEYPSAPSELQIEQMSSSSSSTGEEDLEPQFGGSLEENTCEESPSDPTSLDSEESLSEAPSKRLSWSFSTIYSKAKSWIGSKATSESPKSSLSTSVPTPKSSPSKAGDRLDVSIQRL